MIKIYVFYSIYLEPIRYFEGVKIEVNDISEISKIIKDTFESNGLKIDNYNESVIKQLGYKTHQFKDNFDKIVAECSISGIGDSDYKCGIIV